MNTPTTPTPNLLQLSSPQRRRAEALLLVKVLFPMSTPEQAGILARWITRGERS